MRELTARGYMVSRLEFGTLSGLHFEEMKAGRCFTPSEISSRFSLLAVGDVPEGIVADVERRCVAIYEKVRSGYCGRHTGCCFPLDSGDRPRSDAKCPDMPDIHIIHEWDDQIIKQGVQFRVGTSGGKAREKMGVGE